METMLYYILEGEQRKGPFPESDLVSNGLEHGSLIWHEGLTDWLPARQVPSLSHLLASIPPPIPQTIVPPLPSAASQPPSTTLIHQQKPNPQQNPTHTNDISSRKSFKGIWTLYMIFSALSMLFVGPALLAESQGLLAFGFLLSLIAGVCFCILLYRLWALIQDGYARTTPGKAVGFLFIPFYNFYWIFVAIAGLAKDYNSYTKRHGFDFEPVSQELALAACILTVCSIIPLLGMLSALAATIITFVLMYSLSAKADAIVNSGR